MPGPLVTAGGGPGGADAGARFKLGGDIGPEEGNDISSDSFELGVVGEVEDVIVLGGSAGAIGDGVVNFATEALRARWRKNSFQ